MLYVMCVSASVSAAALAGYGQLASSNMTTFALPAAWLYSTEWHATSPRKSTAMLGPQLASCHFANAVSMSCCAWSAVICLLASCCTAYPTHDFAQ